MSSRAGVRKLHPASSRRKAAARSSWRHAAVIAIAIAVVSAVAWIGVRESADPRFALKMITVSGAQRSTPKEIIMRAGLPMGANVWLLDTAAARRRVESDPRIQSAAVHRVWPNAVRIAVVERQAVAALRLPASAEDPTAQPDYALVDASARVIAVGPLAARDIALPVLELDALPPGASRAGSDVSRSEVVDEIDAMRRLAGFGVRCTEIDADRARGIIVKTDAGLRVEFGSLDDFDKKVSLFKTIVERLTDTRRVRLIDVRSTSAPTVVYY